MEGVSFLGPTPFALGAPASSPCTIVRSGVGEAAALGMG